MNIQKVRRCTCWTSPTFALIYSLILSISPLVLPFVSIISSLILVSSSYSDYKWRELKGISREFFSREIQNSVVPIILISRRLLFLPFVLFLLSFFFLTTTQQRQDGDVTRGWWTWRGASWTKLETMWRRHTGSPARFIRARRTQKAFYFFA